MNFKNQFESINQVESTLKKINQFESESFESRFKKIKIHNQSILIIENN